MRKLLLLGLACTSTTAWATLAYAPMSQTLNDGGSELTLAAEYFKPTSIVTEDGEGQALTANNFSVQTNIFLSYKYGLTSDLEVSALANLRSVQSAFTISSGNDAGDYAVNKVGFESAGLGFRYGIPEENKISMSLEGYYLQKMFSNQELDGNLIYEDTNLGDESREYAIGGSASLRTISNNFFEFQAFYRSPAEYLSTEVFSQLQTTIRWDYFAAYFGLENVYSLENSPYSNDETDRPNFAVVNSKYFNSINRSWTAPYVGVNIRLGTNWRLRTRFTQVYTGNSTDLGPRIFVGFSKRVDKSKEYAKRDQKFKEYRMEGVVQRVSKSRKIVVIDLGLKKGLKRGMRVDFYYFDYVGGNELIARGVVYKSTASKAVVKITKRYGRRRVQEGTVARAGEFRD